MPSRKSIRNGPLKHVRPQIQCHMRTMISLVCVAFPKYLGFHCFSPFVINQLGKLNTLFYQLPSQSFILYHLFLATSCRSIFISRNNSNLAAIIVSPRVSKNHIPTLNRAGCLSPLLFISLITLSVLNVEQCGLYQINQRWKTNVLHELDAIKIHWTKVLNRYSTSFNLSSPESKPLQGLGW